MPDRRRAAPVAKFRSAGRTTSRTARPLWAGCRILAAAATRPFQQGRKNGEKQAALQEACVEYGRLGGARLPAAGCSRAAPAGGGLQPGRGTHHLYRLAGPGGLSLPHRYSYPARAGKR